MNAFLGKVVRRLRRELQEIYWEVDAIPIRIRAWLANRRGESAYARVTEEELKKTRKAETVFIFGSGFSINSITAEEWEGISRYDTVSFREFPRQDKIRADYHLTAEVDSLEEYARLINENPHYRNTIFCVQGGWRAINGNQLVGRRLLRPGAKLFRWRRLSPRKIRLPTESFSDGIVHLCNSLSDAVNFSYLMGWKRIVLVGVDLNDKRYFWLPPDILRGYEKKEITSVDDEFPTLPGVLEFMSLWREKLNREGVSVEVWNPKSALTRILPVYAGPPKKTMGAVEKPPTTPA